jgi:dihydroflavonol-4-reductase
MEQHLLNGAKVLVTGATGFTGSVLTRKLIKLGAEVTVIARKPSSIASFTKLPIKWIIGNVYDKDVVQAAMEDIEYIFHVAAAFREAKVSNDEYRKVHLDSTMLLAEEAYKKSNFKRFIHISTMGVHGHIENPPGDETSPFSPGDLYQETKAEAETWLKQFGEETKLPYTIIRPTAIFGPGDKRLLKVFKMSTLPVFPILGFGKCLYHLIHVEDLTDAIILSATKQTALGEAFIIGNSQAIRLSDIVNIISKSTGIKPLIVRFPASPFFVIASLCEIFCKPFGIEPPLYRRRVAFYTKDRSFNTTKMQSVLGFSPRYSNESGIKDTANWYIEEGWINSKKPSTSLKSNLKQTSNEIESNLKQRQIG